MHPSARARDNSSLYVGDGDDYGGGARFKEAWTDGPGVNPFRNQYPPWTPLRVLSAVVAGIVLAPVRVLLFLVCAALLLPFAWLATMGLKDTVGTQEKPLGGCRRVLLMPLRLLARIALLTMGFWWIRVVDRREDPSVPFRLVVVNHVGSYDAMWLFWYFGCSF
eukprot:RCo049256